MACSDKYLFVISTLKNKVEVFSRDKLERVSSLTVGDRPSHISISPNGSTIAITSIGENDFIPDTVYEKLPSLLKDSCNVFNDRYEIKGNKNMFSFFRP